MEFKSLNEHRNELPANPAFRAGIHLPVRTGYGVCRVELVQLRRKAAAEDIRPRQRQEPDAGSLTGYGTEQTD